MNRLKGGLITPDQLKKEVLSCGSFYSIDELATLMNLTPLQAIATLRRWIEKGKIFELCHYKKNLYPAYLFDEKKSFDPHPVTKKVIDVLSEKWGPWQMAFWFISKNRFLNGKAPYESLVDSPDLVFHAAIYETNPSNHG